MRVLFVTLLVLISVMLSATASGQQRVVWLTDDRGDLDYLLSEESYSIGMDTTNQVLAQLKGFRLDFDYASIARIDAQLATTHNTCVANRIKTSERAQKNHFSLPLNIHPLAQLYYRPSRVEVAPELLNDQGQVKSLMALMQYNPEAKIAIIEGISFGPDLDQQIEQLPFNQISYFSVDNRYESGPKLLMGGFVDMSLNYPSEIQKYLEPELSSDELDSLPIAQQKQFVVSHIACSQSELGRRVIDEVNRILKSIYGSVPHIEAHLRHVPKANHSDLRTFYHQTFSH